MNYHINLYDSITFDITLVSRNISIEETEELISNKEKGPSLFVGNILEDTQKAQHELREIVQRHNMLINLEKVLEEIRDMFFHISTFVMEQGK